MKQLLLLVLAAAVFVNTAGCGAGGNTVEFPENIEPMPKEPPVAAGVPAPSEQPKTTEQR
jgi:hypothetical protein